MKDPKTTRTDWIDTLERVVRPVFESLAAGQLRARMPVQCIEGQAADRARCTHLEALGRSLAGVAGWLSCPGLKGEEAQRQTQLAARVRAALTEAVRDGSPDRMRFDAPHQALVDTAFLAHGLLRAKDALWEPLDTATRAGIVAGMRESRQLLPGYNNWLLFSAMVEAFLCEVGEWWDRMRVDHALRSQQSWYLGDGTYGDGPRYHWDYYNSFVIQPMLLDILETTAPRESRWEWMLEPARKRAGRYAAVQERLIGPDGSFPPVGRSLAYRCGAFQHLAQMAWREDLPPGLPAAQIRCALTAVIKRTLEAPGTFDKAGWLRIGLCGSQPSLGEGYISTGSLYLCSTAFLPLGLPPEAAFWSEPDAPWTQQRIWRGDDLSADHASD